MGYFLTYVRICLIKVCGLYIKDPPEYYFLHPAARKPSACSLMPFFNHNFLYISKISKKKLDFNTKLM